MITGTIIEGALLLALTIGVEVAVAALFRMRGRGLGAVALVSVATNPILNLLVVGLSGIVYTMADTSQADWIYNGTLDWGVRGIVLILEIGVVLIEWRLLVWALGRTSGTSRKLLTISAVMNLASAVIVPVAIGLMAMAYVMAFSPY